MQSTKSLDESIEKKYLRRNLELNKKILNEITLKVDKMKIEFLILKNEFDKKVGYLYVKLDLINLDLEEYKKRLNLLRKKVTKDKMEQEVEAEFGEYKKKVQQETDSMHRSNEIYESLIRSNEEKNQLNMLYKKLVLMYHPDLVKKPKTKVKFEHIMKQINKAYAENDLKALKEFEEELYEIENKGNIEIMKKQLDRIKKTIINLENVYAELLNSKWQKLKLALDEYKAQGKDFYNELKFKIENEINIKSRELNLLKMKYESNL